MPREGAGRLGAAEGRFRKAANMIDAIYRVDSPNAPAPRMAARGRSTYIEGLGGEGVPEGYGCVGAGRPVLRERRR